MITIQENPYAEDMEEEPFVIMCENHDEVETALDYAEAQELANNPEDFCEGCRIDDRVSV